MYYTLILLLLACVSSRTLADSVYYDSEVSDDNVGGNTRQDSNAWVFGSYHTHNHPHTFFDSQEKLIGHDVDMVNEVCSIARKVCRVSVTPFELCINPIRGQFAPGLGLITGYFDGCLGIWNAPYRQSIIDFSMPYRPVIASYLWKRIGDTTFEPSIIAGKTIVDIKSWSSRLNCLTKNGFTSFNGLTVTTSTDAISMVLNGTADALLSSPEPAFEGLLEMTGVGLTCSAGTSIMVTMGSTVPKWWNEAYTKYVSCGCYRKRCHMSQSKYGAAPRCFRYNEGFCSNDEKRRFCP